jgi:hypothetical protein
MPRRDYDVLVVSDFRHGGGTTASIAQEVEIQARMGLRTGLVQVDATYLPAGPWADRMRALVAAGLADAVPATEAATGCLLVLRHPRVFEAPGWRVAARGERTLMIANQVPSDGARDKPYYDVARVRARLREELGVDPPWAPIGPAVRDALGTAAEQIDADWYNVIDADAWAPRGERHRDGALTIGRHARDDVKKWPERREDLFAAYPDDGSRRVRVLGGASALAKRLGVRPRTWEVLPFGSVPAEEFLAGLDAFVYFHHSGMREAFGRSVLEALASGLPVVTHRYLERVFGDACVYAEPRETPGILDALPRGERNARGLALVRERYDWEEHRRRLAAYLGALPPITRRPPARRRVLFVGGAASLARGLAIAAGLPDDHEPRFLAIGDGVAAVRDRGHAVDLVPDAAAAGLAADAWQRYLDERVAAALRVLRPGAVVVDGAPPAGLRAALARFPTVRLVDAAALGDERAAARILDRTAVPAPRIVARDAPASWWQRAAARIARVVGDKAPSRAVRFAPQEELAAPGTVVELRPDLDAADPGDRLELAAYAIHKLRALANVYGPEAVAAAADERLRPLC